MRSQTQSSFAFKFALLAFFSPLIAFTIGCGQAGLSSRESVADRAACMHETQAWFTAHDQEQLKWYNSHGGEVPANRRTQYFPGTNGKAVAVIHGFISSPQSMMDIAQPLIEQGYSVALPLMTGFGAGGGPANAADLDLWRSSVRTAIETLQNCHSEVSVVAHSLGAAVVTDEIVHRGLTNVSKLVLLAPYYRTQLPHLNKIVSLLRTRFSVLNLEFIRRYFGIDPYTVIPALKPSEGYEDPYLPLTAAAQVLELQNSFQNWDFNKLDIPVLVAVSENDLITNGAFASRYLSIKFKNVEKVVYGRETGVGHSLQTSWYNPRFPELMEKISAHLAQ